MTDEYIKKILDYCLSKPGAYIDFRSVRFPYASRWAKGFSRKFTRSKATGR